jgi:hypothetical protein
MRRWSGQTAAGCLLSNTSRFNEVGTESYCERGEIEVRSKLGERETAP